MSNRAVRIVLATVIAPLAVVPIIFVYLAVIDPTASSAASLLQWFMVFAYVGLLIAYSATVVFGLPVYLLLVRLKKTSYIIFAIVGATAAVVIGVFLLDFQLDDEGLVFLVILVVCGLSVSTIFRRIAGLPVQSELTHE